MNIIGHQKQLNILQKSIAKNTLAQAYLFVGPENVGKFTVALDFAEKLTDGKGQSINPDLIIIRPENEEKEVSKDAKKKKTSIRKEIKIDQIREMQKQLSFSPQKGKFRVAIIDEAEKLNRQSQNSLLKILEEPNDSSIIILVAKNETKFLPTILSRCQKIKFGPMSDSEIEKWAEAENIFSKNMKNKERIIFWSLGRPGLVWKLIEDEAALVFREEALKELKNLPEQNLTDKFALAEEMAKNKEAALEKMNVWLILLRQSVLGEGNVNINPAKALKIVDAINKSLEILRDTNANTRLVMENLLLKF